MKRMSERRKFSDYEKKSVYAKCNGTCAICGNPVKYKKMTIDHIVPLSKGGTNGMDNLQLACKRCNLMKSDFSTEEFLVDTPTAKAMGFLFLRPLHCRKEIGRASCRERV